MLILPSDIMPVLLPFAQLFSERIWQWVQVLIVGAILAPGRRTVTAILRVMGLSHERQFQNYHRVLNRVTWSGLQASRILLGLLVTAFVAAGVPLVLAADETLERRSGPTSMRWAAFRDAVRSTKKRTVMSFGLRWISMMLLVPVPWSTPRVGLAVPNRSGAGQHSQWRATPTPQNQHRLGRSDDRHGTALGARASDRPGGGWRVGRCQTRAALPAGARAGQLYLSPTPGCLPLRPVPTPAQQRRAALRPNTGRACQLGPAGRRSHNGVDGDSVSWYGGTTRTVDLATGPGGVARAQAGALTVALGHCARPAGHFAPQFLFATDQAATPAQIVTWFVMRWSEEVTFAEVRAHLGVETQRQWSPLAIERTTPVLLGLFAVVTLLAEHLRAGQPHPRRTAAWYIKRKQPLPTRSPLCASNYGARFSSQSPHRERGPVTLPAAVLEGLLDAICYAA